MMRHDGMHDGMHDRMHDLSRDFPQLVPQFESDSSTIINDVIIVIICLNFSRMRCCKNEKS